MTSDGPVARRRLHPAAFLVEMGQGLAGIAVPVIFAIVFGAKSAGGGLAYAVIGVLASAAYGLLRWQTTAYWVAGGALHHRSGILSPDERTVPAARIGAIDEVQGPVQRAFGVVSLHVQTAGGGTDGEIVLTAVAREDADELRTALGDARAARPDAAAVWRIGRRDLVLAALTGPQLRILGPVVAGGYAVLQNLDDDETQTIVSELPTTPMGWVALVAVLLGVVLLVSLAGAIVAFAGFEITRDADRIRIRRGLLARRAASIAVSRVHGLRIIEGALPRRFGLCMVRIEVAGYRSEPSAAQTLLPICHRSELAGIVAQLLPDLPVPAGEPGRPPRRALLGAIARPSAAAAALAALGALVAVELDVAPVVWVAPAAAALVGALLGVVRHRAAGWWLADGVVGARTHRIVARTTTLARTRRLQETSLRQTVLQRRSRLASARFAVASQHRAAAAHLDAAEARALVACLAEAARS